MLRRPHKFDPFSYYFMTLLCSVKKSGRQPNFGWPSQNILTLLNNSDKNLFRQADGSLQEFRHMNLSVKIVR